MSRSPHGGHLRLNISLPVETVQLLSRIAKTGTRSRLIDVAIRHYAKAVGQRRLKALLKEGAIKHRDRDLQLAREWFALEDEAWPPGGA